MDSTPTMPRPKGVPDIFAKRLSRQAWQAKLFIVL